MDLQCIFAAKIRFDPCLSSMSGLGIHHTSNKKEPLPQEAYYIKQCLQKEALRLGFVAMGIARAEEVDEAARLQHLAKRARYGVGDMTYLERNDHIRFDPRLLLPGAQSIIMLAFNYYPAEKQSDEVPQIACYAYGTDYHKVVKDKLYILVNFLKERISTPFKARVFVDSAPFMERYWAMKAGIGRIARNGLVLIPDHGSFCFLSEILLTLPLPYDSPLCGSPCGNCHRCMEACPMGAITESDGIIPTKCISYQTIESKSKLPSNFPTTGNRFIFGCDQCQLVCPYNRKLTPHQEPQLSLRSSLLNLSKQDWLNLPEEVFESLAHESPLKRAGIERIRYCVRHLSDEEKIK